MKVVGYGDNVVDRYVNKNVYFPGGNAVNFAAYAKENGVDAAFLGVFGDDVEAEHVKSALTDLGIDISACKTLAGKTTERCDVNLVDGDRVFVGVDTRDTWAGWLPLGQSELDYLKGFDLIHSGCYAAVQTEIEKLKGFKSLVSYDFSEEEKFRTDEYLKMVCPYIDIALFSGNGYTQEQLYALQEKVHNMGTTYVLVTMGMKGQILYDGEKRYNGRIEPGKGIDTMGAGDSFFTSFVVSLLKNGWKKGTKVSAEALNTAFEVASKYSAKVCFVEGAFGYGKKIHE